MNISNEFVTAMALEVQALEDIFVSAKQEYHSTPSLLGKRWYAIGLESNDSDKEKDDANKSGIVRRMIESVINFIKRIIDRITAFFKGRKKDGGKDNAANSSSDSHANAKGAYEPSKNLLKIVKEYQNASDEDKEDAVHTVRTALIIETGDTRLSPQDMREALVWASKLVKNLLEPYEEGTFARKIELDKSKWDKKYLGIQAVYLDTNFSQKRFLHVVDVTEHLRGGGSGADQGKSEAEKTVDSINETQQIRLYAMLNPDFVKDAKALADKAYNSLATKHPDDSDVAKFFEMSDELKEYLHSCQETLKESKEVSAEKRRKALVDVVANSSQLHQKFFNIHDGWDLMIKHCNQYLDSLLAMMEKLKTQHDGATKAEMVSNCQKLGILVSAMVSLFFQLDSGYNTLLHATKTN